MSASSGYRARSRTSRGRRRATAISTSRTAQRAGALRVLPPQGAVRRVRAEGRAVGRGAAPRRRSTRRAASSSSTSKPCASPASGALYEKFERLEGAARGRRMVRRGAQASRCPPFPRAIGIVTSSRAAALSRHRDDGEAPLAGDADDPLSDRRAGARRRGRDRGGDRARRTRAPKSTC